MTTHKLPTTAADAATIIVGSDRTPATIIAFTPKILVVRKDNTTLNGNKKTYTENPDGAEMKFSKRKNNQFHLVGTPMSNKITVSVGVRDFYRDPSF